AAPSNPAGASWSSCSASTSNCAGCRGAAFQAADPLSSGSSRPEGRLRPGLAAPLPNRERLQDAERNLPRIEARGGERNGRGSIVNDEKLPRASVAVSALAALMTAETTGCAT